MLLTKGIKLHKSCIRLMGHRIWRRRTTWIIALIIILCTTCLLFINLCIFSTREPKLLHIYVGESDSYPLRIETPRAASRQQKYILVILILTGVDNVDRRNTIRRTWLKNYKSKSVVRARFSVGIKNLHSSKLELLNLENIANGDMMFLGDFSESYKNLTAKLTASLIWLYEHHYFVYMLKVDDDSFVILDRLLKSLHDKPTERFYYGFFDGRAHIKKTGKWAEKDWFMCDRYLPYALGGGYVLTYDLVKYIATNYHLLKHYTNEDVSLGSWLSPLDITREHDPRFDTEFMSRGCHNDYIITHKQSIEMMTKKQWNLDNKGVLCESENITRFSYIYDWSALPSHCCQRKPGIP